MDFIPAKDADFDLWSNNFSTKLTAAPTSVGLVAGDATAYATLHTAWHAALLLATNPSTRTSSTVADKDTKRTAAETKARALAVIIQGYPGTTNILRSDFGLTVPDLTPTPIGPPSTKPVVNVEKINNLEHVLRIRDESTPTSNAKPDGTVGAEVYRFVGLVAPSSIADADYVGLATRVPFVVDFAPGDARKDAFYFVRWINAKGERGPVSDITSATIAA